MTQRVLRFGVMGCSRFALRAMVPALLACDRTELVAIASRSPEKARTAARRFDCAALAGYEALIDRDDVDCIYMPLPTGLHETWAIPALGAGKHLLVEKSFAMNSASARRILDVAERGDLCVAENFLFPHHSQWRWIQERVEAGDLGDVHLVRSTFGFPPPPRSDFRWDATLGGGALLDAGAYMTKIVRLLLGSEARLVGAALTRDLEAGVDAYGEAMYRSPAGRAAQVAFGFGYHYQCSLELLGTRGKLTATRILTAPPGLEPLVRIEHQDDMREILLQADDHYVNLLRSFTERVADPDGRRRAHQEVLEQSCMLDELRIRAEAAEGA